MLSLSC